MKCKNCGLNNPEGAKYCAQCGRPLNQNTYQKHPVSSYDLKDTKRKSSSMVLRGLVIIVIFLAVVSSVILYLWKTKKAPNEIDLEDNDKSKTEVTVSENLIDYEWVVEPTILADDIYYLKTGNCYQFSFNELNQQKKSKYAVIRQGDTYGLVDLDGKMFVDMDCSSIGMYENFYFLNKIEPEYDPEYDCNMGSFYVDDESEQIKAAVAMRGDIFGYKGFWYYCNNEIYNTNEVMSGIGVGTSNKPVQIAFPIQQSSEKYNVLPLGDRKWMDSLESKYAVYCEGVLSTDFIYDECGSESSGLLAVKKDGKWGYVDQTGEVIIPIEYDASWNDYYALYSDNSLMKDYCYAASEGFVPLVKNDVWEMRDTEGELVINPGEFEQICPVYDGKCWVKKDGKWGVIKVAESSEEERREIEKTNESEEEFNSNEKSTMSITDICQTVEDYYNTINNTDTFVVMEGEATQTEEGYRLILRHRGGNTPNVFVCGIYVNTETGEVKDDKGTRWFLYD